MPEQCGALSPRSIVRIPSINITDVTGVDQSAAMWCALGARPPFALRYLCFGAWLARGSNAGEDRGTSASPQPRCARRSHLVRCPSRRAPHGRANVEVVRETFGVTPARPQPDGLVVDSSEDVRVWLGGITARWWLTDRSGAVRPFRFSLEPSDLWVLADGFENVRRRLRDPQDAEDEQPEKLL